MFVWGFFLYSQIIHPCLGKHNIVLLYINTLVSTKLLPQDVRIIYNMTYMWCKMRGNTIGYFLSNKEQFFVCLLQKIYLDKEYLLPNNQCVFMRSATSSVTHPSWIQFNMKLYYMFITNGGCNQQMITLSIVVMIII